MSPGKQKQDPFHLEAQFAGAVDPDQLIDAISAQERRELAQACAVVNAHLAQNELVRNAVLVVMHRGIELNRDALSFHDLDQVQTIKLRGVLQGLDWAIRSLTSPKLIEGTMAWALEPSATDKK